MLLNNKWNFKKPEVSFSILDWYHALMIAGIRRGNGKYNPAKLYQGFATLKRSKK